MAVVERAPLDFEHPLAPAAPKMVVVGFPRDLVQGAPFRGVDLLQPARFHQQLQVAVHRRLVQGADAPSAGLEDLLYGKRAVVLAEDLPDGVALARLSLHPHISVRHPSA